jgi:hypothetical protein
MNVVHAFERDGYVIIVTDEEVPVGKIFGHDGCRWKVKQVIPATHGGKQVFGHVVERQPTLLEQLHQAQVEAGEKLCVDLLQERDVYGGTEDD